jgi:hypothetical protein
MGCSGRPAASRWPAADCSCVSAAVLRRPAAARPGVLRWPGWVDGGAGEVQTWGNRREVVDRELNGSSALPMVAAARRGVQERALLVLPQRMRERGDVGLGRPQSGQVAPAACTQGARREPATARGHVGLLAGRSDSLGAAHGSPSVRSHRRRGWVHSGVAQTSVRRRIDPMTRGRHIRNARARTRAR